jgi:predicted histone-like DNA-binding protein
VLLFAQLFFCYGSTCLSRGNGRGFYKKINRRLPCRGHKNKKNMKYKLIQRKNPLQPTQEGKWYASPVNDGKIDQKTISAEIVEISSLARGDVANVIESLLDTLPKYLLMGKSVNLGDLGTLRLSFSSEGVENPEDFHTTMISGTKVVFTPSVELKHAIENIKFEKA